MTTRKKMKMIEWQKLDFLQRDALIAENVFGWQWIAYQYPEVVFENQLWLLPDKESTKRISRDDWSTDQDGKFVRCYPYWIPNYSKELKVAWKIVECFDEMELSHHQGTKSNGEPGQIYICSFNTLSTKQEGICIAENVIDAICIAALRNTGLEIVNE
jgi:hypothetical protein